MEINNEWIEFITKAEAILLEGQPINRFNQRMELVVKPSFSNSINLQLEIQSDEVKWSRTTWLRADDEPKFVDPIENLKYIGKEIEPSVNYETGSFPRTRIEHILESVENTSLKPILNPNQGMTLDGETYTLTIGSQTESIMAKWHVLPDEWDSLWHVVKLLLELNETLG